MPRRFPITRSVLLQVLAWVAFLLLPGVFRPGHVSFIDLIFDLFRPVRLFTGLFCVLTFYLTYAYVVPRVLVPRHYLRFAGIMVGVAAAFLLLEFAIAQSPRHGGAVHLRPVDAPWPPAAPPGQARSVNDPRTFRLPALTLAERLFSGFGPGSSLYQLLITLGAAFALGLAKAWRQEREQRLATEIAFLRSQINPHFLFNTLNTLYALALAKSDSAPEAVLRLAAIMRYAVAQSGQTTVPLADELAYLEGYIELQRLRLPPSMEVHYHFPEDVAGAFIAPLLLIIPIENAFTHGVGQEKAGRIDISLRFEPPILMLEMENSVPPVRTEHAAPNTGTGLVRLNNYLTSRYAGRHVLDIDADAERYRLTLTLTLDG